MTQGYSFEYIIEILSRYTCKFICIEFMPNGLWLRGNPVRVPPYYKLENFLNYFERKFNLLAQKQVDENYVVIIGEKIYDLI